MFGFDEIPRRHGRVDGLPGLDGARPLHENGDTDAALRYGVEIRCEDVFAVVESRLGITHVIGKDDDAVGIARVGSMQGCHR